jgi:hypothetical protein
MLSAGVALGRNLSARLTGSCISIIDIALGMLVDDPSCLESCLQCRHNLEFESYSRGQIPDARKNSGCFHPGLGGGDNILSL